MTYDCKDCKYNSNICCIPRKQKGETCDGCPQHNNISSLYNRCKCLEHLFNNDRNREPCKYYVKREE